VSKAKAEGTMGHCKEVIIVPHLNLKRSMSIHLQCEYSSLGDDGGRIRVLRKHSTLVFRVVDKFELSRKKCSKG